MAPSPTPPKPGHLGSARASPTQSYRLGRTYSLNLASTTVPRPRCSQPSRPASQTLSKCAPTPSALTPAPLQQPLTHRTRISPHLGHSPTEHPHLSSLILKYQMQSYLRAQEAFTGCRTEDGSSEGTKVVPFTLPQAGQCLHQPRGLTSVM